MSNIKWKKFLSSLLIVNTLLIAGILFADQAEQQQPQKENNSEHSPFTVFQFSILSPLQIFS